MHVTVAIATWNRCEMLRRTLAGMCRMRTPPGLEWELFVVNNNCADATDEVIESFRGQLPIRRLFEPKQGLSNGRNCAIDAARGELIAFTDDDVSVAPEWLAAYAQAAARWPQAVYFGGPIVPSFESDPPAWMRANLVRFRNMFGVRNLGEEERPFEGEEGPFGGNMAYRRQVFEQWQFDPNLGRSGNGRMMGEETALLAHLRSQGMAGVWVPRAKLEHFIPQRCFTRKYIWDYFEGQGRTAVHMHGAKDGKKLWGVPRQLLRRYWEARLKSWLCYPVRREAWVRPFIRAAKTRGMIRESLARRCCNGNGDH
jgi:glycosyltransferase involved in cell wall biosynthesis